MEAVRDLTSTLWTIRTNQETTRIYRTTQSLLRFFLFFDICYLISGIALVTMALANQMEEVARTVCLCLQVQTLLTIELGTIGVAVINSISFVNSL